MTKPHADERVFGEIRRVFARFGLRDFEVLEATITLVAVFARVLGVPHDQVIKKVEESLATAPVLDPRKRGSA